MGNFRIGQLNLILLKKACLRKVSLHGMQASLIAVELFHKRSSMALK